MTPDLARARQLVGQATAGRSLDRSAVLDWYDLRERASGEEAEQIGYLAEALLVAARDPAERSWLEALLDGGPDMARSQEERMTRADATDKPAEDKAAAAKPEEGGGIDWAKVAREANTMVELNKAASEGWQGQRDHKASK